MAVDQAVIVVGFGCGAVHMRLAPTLAAGPGVAVHQAIIMVVVDRVGHGRGSFNEGLRDQCAGASWNCAVSVLCSIAVVEERPPEAAIATASK